MKDTFVHFKEIVNSCKNVFTNKMKDYGAAWRILRLPSLTDQIYIKIKRIRALQQNKRQKIAEDEGVEFVGVINYAVMALIQCEKGVADHPDFSQKEVEALYDNQIEITFQLMEDKNHDYKEAWRDMRIESMTDLILQKLLRIKQIEDNHGKTEVSEGVDANYRDIINYAIFALILRNTIV